jgi:GntR family transcriptional regulator / MocR family aminotransferase
MLFPWCHFMTTTRSRKGPLLTVPLDPGTGAPLFRQLYEGLRNLILEGRVAAGARLPATRRLADELGVSRNTVVSAYEQLLAEGYLEGWMGSGTYVPRALPDEMIAVRPAASPGQTAGARRPRLSRRGKVLVQPDHRASCFQGVPRPFRISGPALEAFPHDIWRRLVARHHRRPPPEHMSYDHPAGFGPLRQAIAEHLGQARAVHCDPEQVLILAGAQQAFDLSTRLLLDPGDQAWVEHPGYPGMWAVLRAAAVDIVPVPVDGEGLDVSAGQRLGPDARLVYVTPSHQYPLGVTLSLARRLALLDWARRAGAWIIEDDYDSEFRYTGRPLAALQGLDPDGRVLYVGTFSKSLYPALRLAYLVVPPNLVEAFAAARAVTDRQGPTLMQAVVADFLREGHFVRHVRRMRTLYYELQETLLRAAQRDLDGLVELGPSATGMQVVGWLEPGRNDMEVSRAAARGGVEAAPLSSCCITRPERGGLLLGYAGFDARQIRDGVRRLAAGIRPLRNPC